MKRKLPIGIQTFSHIRQGGYYYVDKTALAIRLCQEGKHYFLSRPRRFGKSLFLDTLKELFEANAALFEGLAAQQQWDWSVSYPVLRFSFGGESYKRERSLTDTLDAQLQLWEQHYQLPPTTDSIGGRFAHLLVKLHQQAGQPVVVLIDEYDKPILDALSHPELAHANRDFLRGFYGN
ncbi:MAG: AAA family ATPase, partial [Thiolinea sp.]